VQDVQRDAVLFSLGVFRGVVGRLAAVGFPGARNDLIVARRQEWTVGAFVCFFALADDNVFGEHPARRARRKLGVPAVRATPYRIDVAVAALRTAAVIPNAVFVLLHYLDVLGFDNRCYPTCEAFSLRGCAESQAKEYGNEYGDPMADNK
jgi:hypothetical protein